MVFPLYPPVSTSFNDVSGTQTIRGDDNHMMSLLVSFLPGFSIFRRIENTGCIGLT